MNFPALEDVSLEMRGSVAIVTLLREQKRNALSDRLMASLDRVLADLPEGARAGVLRGRGPHFSAGLDLSELAERDAVQGLHHSRSWLTILEKIEKGRVPFVAAISGACVGGGLEIAACCHLRVADESAFFAFPEGMRGIFVGGGGSVRVPKLIGVHRMLDMMLTGRVYEGAEAVAAGFAQYLVPAGSAFDKALELAERITQNAPMTNYALIHGLPRIAEQPADHGFLTESLLAAIAQSAPEAKQRLREFLEGRAAKVKG